MSKIDEILKEAEVFKKEADKIIQETLEKGESFLKKGLDAIFETYPHVESISWTQYTPYFNDGDPCTFESNTWSVELNGTEEYSDEVKAIPDSKEICSKTSSLLAAIGDDALELLGEGQVVVQRNGKVTIEEYEHD